MKIIARPAPLQQLHDWRGQDLIKVITGIRRAGKSTLLDLFAQDLLSGGVDKRQIVRLNFEDPDLLFTSAQDCYHFIQDQITCGQKTYLLLDEVQNIPDCQRVLDGLYLDKNIDLYVTGSNAYLLSGELATLLSGRFVQLSLLPLSLSEYQTAFPDLQPERLYQHYLETSSFPYAINLPSPQQRYQYLTDLYHTILVKDVVARAKLLDTSQLSSVATFMFANAGCLLSVNKISHTLESEGLRVSPHTIVSYLDLLTRGFIFYPLRRYDIKGRAYLRTGAKYYPADPSLRYAVAGRRNLDLGQMLENVVFLELLRRDRHVYLGKIGEREIDFVTDNLDTITYYQVALTVRDPQTLKRELSALRQIDDHYPKYLLTLDPDPPVSHDGIQQLNVLDWLLQG